MEVLILLYAINLRCLLAEGAEFVGVQHFRLAYKALLRRNMLAMMREQATQSKSCLYAIYHNALEENVDGEYMCETKEGITDKRKKKTEKKEEKK